jgi:glutamine synthetase
MPDDKQIAEFMQVLQAKNIRFLRFELPDTAGMSRAKVVPIDKVERYLQRGLNFYGGTIGLDSASGVVVESGVHGDINYRDQKLFADLDTVQVIPWLEDTAKVICDGYWSEDEPVAGAPRMLLRRLLERAEGLGYRVKMGHEFEYYLLNAETHEPLFGGVHIFNSVRNHYVPLMDTLLDNLRGVGIDVITHNCEYSPSQFETNFGPAIGLAAADKAFTFKNAMKELGHRGGYLVTFMTKPATAMAGCGCHVHLSLENADGGGNAFQGDASAGGMSDVMRSFTEGVLAHAQALMPLIAPTVNCYRRYRPHTFAPSNVSWGVEDRTAMVRMKDVGTDDTHIEIRAGSGLSNPYLSAAGVLAAGLLGLEAKPQLRDPVDGPAEENASLDPLPRSFDAALAGLAADKAMQDILGADFTKVFLAVKQHELARFHDHVSDWERDEYMELY